MPCLVLNPPFHNSKTPLLKTGYITGNYLILREKFQSTILTMKIGYHLINSPFKYHISYLNDNHDYTPLTTNWSLSLELSLELQAETLEKSNYPYPLMTVEPEASIIPSKLLTVLAPLSATTKLVFSPLTNYAPLEKTMFCIMLIVALIGHEQWKKW